MRHPRPNAIADRSRTVRFVTHSPPSPGISGDRIRVFHLMRALKERGWTVRIWSLRGPDEPSGTEAPLRALADDVILVPRDVSTGGRRARLIRDIATRGSFHAHWFWSTATGRAAADWLADAGDEALFVEQLYMYPFIPTHLRSHIVLDTQNLEAARMRAMAGGGGGVVRRLVARLQAGPVTRYERAAVGSVASVLAVSEIEAAAFEQMAPGRVRLIRNGVDCAAIVPLAGPPSSRELLFLGSLTYSANEDAVQHFVADIAPLLRRFAARLTVVGSNPSSSVSGAAAKSAIPVKVTGYVPDLRPHYSGSRAMVVPLRHGGGTRLKILEALAWGLPVVTTSVGAEGLGLRDGRHALIADNPKAFATAVERILRDDRLWLELSKSGRAFAEEHFDWQQIGAAFEATMAEVADGFRAPVLVKQR